MTQRPEEPTLAFLASLRDFLLQNQQKKTALVGAIALAVHGYVRGTEDWDTGVSTFSPQELFEAIKAWLPDEYDLEYTLPDESDPLGGVATITGPDIEDVELVNFYNPHAPGRRTPGGTAIKEARYNEQLGIDVVTPEYLFILKLYSGSLRDLGDAAELVRCLPEDEFDWELVSELADTYGLRSVQARVEADLNR